MPNKGDYISFSDLFSVCLKTIDHLISKLWMLSVHTASFKIEISKVQDFGNFELSPLLLINRGNSWYVEILLERFLEKMFQLLKYLISNI